MISGDITDNQWLAFGTASIGALIAWYTAVLLADRDHESEQRFARPKVSDRQILGIVFYLIAAWIGWSKLIFIFGDSVKERNKAKRK